MEVTLAEKAGFCFGVKRAVDKVNELIDQGGIIYTLGPIIHNEQVVDDFEKKGVKVIESINGLSAENRQKGGSIVIRSHGVGESLYKEIEDAGFAVIDATCPFVKRIHKLVSEQDEGRDIIIVGNDGHPEVEGIKGWCRGRVFVVESEQDIENLSSKLCPKLFIVSQTTFNSNKFKELVDIFTEKRYDIIVVNTICTATEERQKAAEQLASNVDCMLIIGGAHSSNTRKLYDICSSRCCYTYYIQTLEDLNFDLPASVKHVGITAGASTPNKIIEEVQNYVRLNF